MAVSLADHKSGSDLNISSVDNLIHTKTYFKSVQANNYVLANSQHNPQWLRNIPKGQFVRLRRNCSSDETFASQFLKFQWAAKRLPPGPTPLPFIGNLWTLKFQLHHEILMQLAKTYGNIFTVWLGCVPFIVLNGYEAVRDGLIVNSEEFSERPAISFYYRFARGKGIVISNGHTWKQQRRFGNETLRNLGLGKKDLEWRIQAEAHILVDIFSAKKERPLDPRSYLVNVVTNVISSLLFGRCFSLDDELYQHLVEGTDLVINFYVTRWGQAFDAFPWLVPHLPGPHHKVLANLDFIQSFVKQEIRNHQNPRDEPKDFIDYYKEQISKAKDDPTSTFNEENMTQVLVDFFISGSETITTTLCWAILYMVAYPDIQEKVQRELDGAFGSSQTIHYEDRQRLPYTNAMIHEIQRFANVAPMGMPRQCVRDIKVQGFLIRKGTILLASLCSSLQDPGHWDTPLSFNPGHFLDKDGNFQGNAAFLPFSAGHRVCLGEQLAKSEVFHFFTSLLRGFSFRLPHGVTEVNLKPVFASTLQPYPYQICAIPR
ncbi:cytochrome P450 2J4-like [Ascaphus truei]|uniref:cytochrome P450 2J4-like n=1 Tax=Ascaphus truei TaxID=8439 RepID=UPI003F5A38D3